MCWPHDIDLWVERNNGRTLTLYDLGRIPWSIRAGFTAVLRRRGWGMTVAGSSVRYRRRIRAFDRFEMRTRAVGWDARFVYSEQSMWRPDGVCANHVLIRSALTSPDGIVPPEEFAAEMGIDRASPPLPAWVAAWVEADATRPWPPMQPGPAG